MPDSGPLLKASAICETVIERKDGVLSLINVIDRIIITATPGAPPRMPKIARNFVLAVMFTSGEFRGMADVNVTMQSPLGLRRALHGQRVLFEGDDRGVNLIFQMSMEFEEEGLYWFEVSVDQKLLTRTALRMVYSPMSQDLPPLP